MLSQSAVPRANHTIRILPPSASSAYAAKHDAAIWETFCKVTGAAGLSEDALAKQVATLPGRLGGLGLRSAERSAPAAYWASWVDALSVIQTKAPDVAATVLHDLESSAGTAPCLQEANAGLELLRSQGAADLPTWAEASQGVRPPQPDEGIDAADLDRGWQCHACSTLEHFFLEQVVLPSSSSARRSLLLSQSGGPASAWLRAIPSEPAFTLSPLRLQVALRRRLRWPLPLSGGRCCRGCNKTLDLLGDRAAACPLAGRLKLRSRPLERTWARVLREAGGRVRENLWLRDAGLPGIDPGDGRRIEVVATGLPVARGMKHPRKFKKTFKSLQTFKSFFKLSWESLKVFLNLAKV